jgi:hypothetical protein
MANSFRYRLIRKLGSSHCQSGHCGHEINSWPCWESNSGLQCADYLLNRWATVSFSKKLCHVELIFCHGKGLIHIKAWSVEISSEVGQFKINCRLNSALLRVTKRVEMETAKLMRMSIFCSAKFCNSLHTLSCSQPISQCAYCSFLWTVLFRHTLGTFVNNICLLKHI